MGTDRPALETSPYPILVVVGAGTLLSAMAGSAVNLALPTLGRELGISIEDSRWVVQAFLLAVGVLLLVAGRLGDLLGHRRVYLAGFSLFGAASLACGLAWSFAALIVFRVLQGVGGAMVMATGPALLTTSFPGKQRGRALGMLATATYAGLTVGPPLGGLIVSLLGWRWTFYINIPFALLVMGLGLRFLPRETFPERPAFDWAGTLALLFGLALGLLALTECQRWGFSSWMTWTLGSLGVSGLVAFVWIQRHRSAPLLDLQLFRSRVFTGSVLSAVANYIAISATTILMPFYLEEGLSRDAARAGMLLSVQPLVMALVASPSGWLSDRIGSRGLATLGMLILAGGLFGLSGLDVNSNQVEVVVWLAIIGLGTGTFISPNSSALMGSAPRHQQGTAGSVLADARVLGMLIGVAVATAIFQKAGGQTGAIWLAKDFSAMQLALQAASGMALLGAVAASLRGAKK